MLEVRELTVRSALNRVAAMRAFSWSLNPYRGCQHACVYCYARATHPYLNLGVGDDFSRILFVKRDLAELLDRELSRPQWRGDAVMVGTATDPYQPIEGRFQLTRRCLEVFLKHRNPVGIITKGTLIQRDIALLAALGQATRLTVLFSIPCVDSTVWRQSEPGTPPPAQRLRVVRRLCAAGIRVGVLMAPILPGISDDDEHLEQAVRAAKDSGAAFVATHMLRLAPPIRPVYEAYLAETAPQLTPQYRSWYHTGPNAPQALQHRAAERVRASAERLSIPFGDEDPLPAAASPTATQLQWRF